MTAILEPLRQALLHLNISFCQNSAAILKAMSVLAKFCQQLSISTTTYTKVWILVWKMLLRKIAQDYYICTLWHTQKQTNKVVCKKAYKKFWPYFALILYFQWYHAMPFDHPLLLTKSQSWTMWVKLSVPHQHWITGIYISFKFMKIIIIHAFTVSYEALHHFWMLQSIGMLLTA